jgi:predicted PurR-regulated permease PerM
MSDLNDLNDWDKNAPPHFEIRLLLLLVVISFALVWILLPFYGTILWGAIIGLLFAPLYRWLLPRLNQRHNPAALLTLLLVLVIVILPFALVTAALAREASVVYPRCISAACSTPCRCGCRRCLNDSD